MYTMDNRPMCFISMLQCVVKIPRLHYMSRVSSRIFQLGGGGGGGGGAASLTSQILYLITTLDHLELGVVDEGLHFLQCRKLLRRVLEHLPTDISVAKTFFRLGRHLAAETQLKRSKAEEHVPYSTQTMLVVPK